MRRAIAVLASLGVLTAAGCATVSPLEDMRIEAEVKARLVAEKDANLTRLGVLSNNAVVHLSGSVESASQAAQAETLAKSVRGVRRVVSTLDVHEPSAKPPGLNVGE